MALFRFAWLSSRPADPRCPVKQREDEPACKRKCRRADFPFLDDILSDGLFEINALNDIENTEQLDIHEAKNRPRQSAEQQS